MPQLLSLQERTDETSSPFEPLRGRARASLAGCGKPFDVTTAPGFVELENQHDFDYRATTPEGVVVGDPVVDLEGEKSGDLAFWTRALTLQLRDVTGYALLETRDVQSRDGTKGASSASVTTRTASPSCTGSRSSSSGKHLVLVEAGGTKGKFERYETSVRVDGQNLRLK